MLSTKGFEFVLTILNFSQEFLTKNGTRQGCCLSPTLFIAALGYVLKQANLINYVAYADNLSFVAESKDDEETTVELIKEKAEKNVLMINEAKTERLELSREANRKEVQ